MCSEKCLITILFGLAVAVKITGLSKIGLVYLLIIESFRNLTKNNLATYIDWLMVLLFTSVMSYKLSGRQAEIEYANVYFIVYK